MSVRMLESDLPICFSQVEIVASGVTILNDITLTFSSGAPTVLIGPNGSGKTTLLKAAMGLLPVTRGRITWAGQDVSPPTRRSIMFQHPVMLRRSVADNIRYALSAADAVCAERERRTLELLSLVGLESFGARPARRLSGGEQQRLSLARALARDPAVLFLDEPTASLDPAATKAIEDIVRTISARGIKLVMATHDLGEARRLAGDVVVLHRGQVIERGPAEKFFAAPSTEEARRFLAGELLI
jgi:tungstate transport system ATP-binding protein